MGVAKASGNLNDRFERSWKQKRKQITGHGGHVQECRGGVENLGYEGECGHRAQFGAESAKQNKKIGANERCSSKR